MILYETTEVPLFVYWFTSEVGSLSEVALRVRGRKGDKSGCDYLSFNRYLGFNNFLYCFYGLNDINIQSGVNRLA
jgi:hypothetical protein